MDSIQYILLFIIVVIGIGGIIAFLLQYKNPDYNIDRSISNNSKFLELMQIKYNIDNMKSNNDFYNSIDKKKRLLDMEKEMYMFENLKIQRLIEADNYTFSIEMMKLTLEERRQNILLQSEQHRHNIDMDRAKITHMIQYQNAQLAGIQSLQNELNRIELEGKKYDVIGRIYDSMNKREAYNQQMNRSIREEELHILKKSMEYLLTKANFESMYINTIKDKKDKEAFEEYINSMKQESKNIFDKFDLQ